MASHNHKSAITKSWTRCKPPRVKDQCEGPPRPTALRPTAAADMARLALGPTLIHHAVLHLYFSLVRDFHVKIDYLYLYTHENKFK
jgi:hypothetical protein